MKTTPQSVRCRVSRIGCNSLSNQQKETKFSWRDDRRSSWFSSLASACQLVQKRRADADALRKLAAGRVGPTRGLSRNGSGVFRGFCTQCLGVRCVLASLLGLVAVCVSSFAQTPDNVAEREVQRRQAGISPGEAALARGKAAMKAKNYAVAYEEFKTASHAICPTQSSPEKRTMKPRKAFAKAAPSWPKRASQKDDMPVRKRS